MSNWIGLGIILVVVICAIAGLAQLSKPYDVSVEEYERRANDGPGLLSAGLIGLQKALDPAMEKAVAVQEDLKQGRYDGEQESGDPPEAGGSEDHSRQPTSGENDA